MDIPSRELPLFNREKPNSWNQWTNHLPPPTLFNNMFTNHVSNKYNGNINTIIINTVFNVRWIQNMTYYNKKCLRDKYIF